MYVRTYNNKLSNNKNDISIALLLKLISIAVSATNRQWFINLCDAAPQSSHNHLQLTIVIIIPSIRHFVLILRGCAKRLKLMRTQCSTDFHKRMYVYMHRVALNFFCGDNTLGLCKIGGYDDIYDNYM